MKQFYLIWIFKSENKQKQTWQRLRSFKQDCLSLKIYNYDTFGAYLFRQVKFPTVFKNLAYSSENLPSSFKSSNRLNSSLDKSFKSSIDDAKWRFDSLDIWDLERPLPKSSSIKE